MESESKSISPSRSNDHSKLNLTQCIICDKNFKDPRSYEPHLKIHLRNNESIEVADAEITKLHNKPASSKKKYNCELCHSKFSTPYALTYHQKNTCKSNQVTIVVEKAKDMINKTTDTKLLHDFNDLVTTRLEVLQQNNTQNNLTFNNDGPSTVVADNSSDSHNQVLNNFMSQTGQGFNISSTSGDVNINHSVIVNRTANNTYNIIVNPHGNEKVEDLPNVLKAMRDSFYKLYKDEDLDEFKNISMEVFKHIYCNEKHPENQNLYVTNARPEVKFYVYKDGDKGKGWEKSGDIHMLMKDYERINGLIKENLETISKNQTYLEEIKTVIDGLDHHYDKNRGPNKCLSRQMGKAFHNTLYNKKEDLEPTFKQTVD